MIEIDGSQGEGGGQILRTALSLSLITQQPFTLFNIRAGRPKTGLLRQHLTCVKAVAALCGVEIDRVEGAALGSERLVFKPKPLISGEGANDYAFNVGSAGSCMLVLQTVLWPLLLADKPSTLVLQGGTHNPFAPSATYLQHTLPPILRQIGGGVDIQIKRHGFYPAGGGEVLVQITPTAQLKPLHGMARGDAVKHFAMCLHAGVPRSVPERELETVAKQLNWKESELLDRGLRQNEGPGNDLIAVLEYEHVTEVFNVLGERGLSAEAVAVRLADQVKGYHTSTAFAGEHLADQLMIPLALAAWQDKTPEACGTYTATVLSEHTRTNATVIERFLPVRFALLEASGSSPATITVRPHA